MMVESFSSSVYVYYKYNRNKMQKLSETLTRNSIPKSSIVYIVNGWSKHELQWRTQHKNLALNNISTKDSRCKIKVFLQCKFQVRYNKQNSTVVLLIWCHISMKYALSSSYFWQLWVDEAVEITICYPLCSLCTVQYC